MISLLSGKLGKRPAKPNIEFRSSSGGTAKPEVSATGNLGASHGSSSSWTSFSNPTRHNVGIFGCETSNADVSSSPKKIKFL